MGADQSLPVQFGARPPRLVGADCKCVGQVPPKFGRWPEPRTYDLFWAALPAEASGELVPCPLSHAALEPLRPEFYLKAIYYRLIRYSLTAEGFRANGSFLVNGFSMIFRPR